MPKKILAAHIDQVLQFDNQAEVDAWKNTLTGTFSIESVIMEPDGTVTVHVKKGYNKNPMYVKVEKE